MRKLTPFVLLLVFIPLVSADLDLSKPKAGGEVTAEDFERLFQLDKGIESLQYLREALGGFTSLGDKVRQDIPVFKADFEALPNASWEDQYLGYVNRAAILEGTLRRQHYECKKAEYELAGLRHERGEATSQAVEEARRAFESSEKAMQHFWDEFDLMD